MGFAPGRVGITRCRHPRFLWRRDAPRARSAPMAAVRTAGRVRR